MGKVYFRNSKGDNLCGILSNPTSSKEKAIVILCHGFNTSKDSQTYKRLEEILNNHKISTFRFDFLGHGESEGKFEDITISEAADDILNAISFLKKEGYSKIGLFGSSFGGIASIMAASKTNDLFVLALKSPVSNYKERDLAVKTKEELRDWKEKGYKYYVSGDGRKLKLNYTFFEDFENNNGYEAAKRIKIPTLIVHGDEDEAVPVGQSKKTANLIENCRLEIIRGADHRYSNPEDFKKMLTIISEFIIGESQINSELYKKVEQFVINSFTKTGNEKGIKHFKRTAYWVQQLQPEADEALLIAAVAHDIERAFRESSYDERFHQNGFRTKEHLIYHQEKGAEIIADFLRKQNADKELIEKVKELISKHEVGGNEKQDILKDADSVSFFENNIDYFITRFVPKMGRESVKDKFDWMFNRISSKKAKQIALPWYEEAIKRLGY